jgi:hypothetical protein
LENVSSVDPYVLSTLITSTDYYGTLYTTSVAAAETAFTTTTIAPSTSTKISVDGISAFSQYITTAITTVSTITFPGTTQTIASVNPVIFSQVGVSTVITTSYIAAGTVYASGIQVRWTGRYPLDPPLGLSPAAKAGISLGVNIIVSLSCFLAWFLFRRRMARKRQTYVTNQPIWEGPFYETGKVELPAPRFANGHSSQFTPGVADTDERESGHGNTEIESNTGNLSPQVFVTPTLNSSLAELGSIGSDSALKRKPISPTVELDPPPALPSPLNPTSPVSLNANKPLPIPLPESHEEQRSIAAVSSTMEDSESGIREGSESGVGEEQRLRAELARVVERKERIRELARLKEEEERLVGLEEELRGRIGIDR